MPSTYSDLKIELMVTGENSTTWGDITNANLVAIEQAISGFGSVAFASADVTLTFVNSNIPQNARAMRLYLHGVTGGARNLILPNTPKWYCVHNSCDDPITVKTLGGTGVAVPAHTTTLVLNDGVAVYPLFDFLPAIRLGAPLPVASGGTGSATAGGSLDNLGFTAIGKGLVYAVDEATARNVILAAKSGDNADITSLARLAGLTTGYGVTDTVASAIELGGFRAGNGDAILDLHATAGTDFDARIVRASGVNGAFAITQTGTEHIRFNVNGAERMRVQSDGSVVVGGGVYSGSVNTGSIAASSSINAAGNIEVRNGAPFVELRNTTNRTGFIHCAGDQFYVLGGAADSTTWSQVGGQWPLQINLTNNDAIFGHNLTLNAGGIFYGNGAGLTGTAGSLNVNYANGAGQATNCTGGTIWNTNFTTGNTISNSMNMNNSGFMNVGGNIGFLDVGGGGWFIRCPYNGQVVIGEYGGRGVYVQGGCTVNGDVYAAGNVGIASDRRLKTDLNRIEGALDKLEQLTGYTYKRTDLGFSQAGIIAQDLQKVLPVAVKETGANHMLNIDIGAVLGLVVEAIKELRADVNYLRGYATK